MEPLSANPARKYRHISARHHPFRLRLGEVWRYRSLIWLFTKRNFKVTYKQTVSRRVDTTALKKLLGDALDEYTKTVVTRPFKVN